MSAKERVLLKIIMVGSSGVGKSSIIKSLNRTYGESPPRVKATVGSDLLKKSIFIDGKEITLAIWDTSGQEKFQSLFPQYFRGAEGAVLVYDITDRSSFERLPYWLDNIRSYALETVKVIIAGNKFDLENRQVTRMEGLEFSKRNQALFIETTIKEGAGISDLFERLAQKILPQHVTYPKPEVVKLSKHTYDVAVKTERGCMESLC